MNLVGTTIAGKYDVEAVVASTALSVVYRATHRVWQRKVAIKAFTAPNLSDETRQELLASFVEEGRLLMDLSERCASICQARDLSSLTTAAGEWVPYTVLEWLDGDSLDTVLRRDRAAGLRPRTVSEAIDLLAPIADALAVAHERGVVHRDVKPGNIFVLSDGRGEPARTKLLDFGVAKNLRGSRVVPAGVVVSQSFTPGYGAPEQFSAAYGATGPWTDVYALALIVVELVTGGEALQGETVSVLAAQSCDVDARPTPRQRGASVSDEVEAVLARALAVRLEDRHPDARSFWNALVDAAEESIVIQGDLDVTWDTAAAASQATPSQGETPSSSDAGSSDVDALLEGDFGRPEPFSGTIPIALQKRRRAGAVTPMHE